MPEGLRPHNTGLGPTNSSLSYPDSALESKVSRSKAAADLPEAWPVRHDSISPKCAGLYPDAATSACNFCQIRAGICASAVTRLSAQIRPIY